MKKNYYCTNEFSARIPINTFEFYEKNLKSICPEDAKRLTQKYYNEGLLISSTNLYQDLKKLGQLKDKETQSLVKYLIRSSVRSTPFGLAAGVLKGKFDIKEDLVIEKEFYKKARLDMEWIIGIIKEIESKLGNDLKIRKNNSTTFKENILIENWKSCFGEVCCEIENLSYLEKKILELSELKYLSIKDLEDIIFKDNILTKGEEIKIFKNSVNKLLKNEVLTSNLRISLATPNIFNELIKRIRSYSTDKIKNDLLNLEEVLEQLNKYNKMSIGQGEKCLKELIEKMKKMHESAHYVQVDMYQNKEIKLKKKIKNELEEFANFITEMSYIPEYSEYISEFKERYKDQAVKLIDLIDESQGIGFPYLNKNSESFYKEKILLKLLNTLSLKGNKNSIDISKWKDKNNLNKIDTSETFECVFELLKDENSENYKFLLSPSIGSDKIGKLTGRFNHIFAPTYIENDKIELSFYPKISHHANVMMNSITNKKFNFGILDEEIKNNNQTFNIDNICVYISNEKLFLMDILSKKKIYFDTSHVYSKKLFPKKLLLLIDISYGQNLNPLSFVKTLKEIIEQDLTYLPEISYKNIIIFPEVWRIELKKYLKDNVKINLEVINFIQNEIKFPDEVKVGNDDQYLILNLKNLVHKKIFLSILKKNESVMVYRNIYSSQNLVIKNQEKENHIGEFVFNFKNQNQNQNELDIDPKYLEIFSNFKEKKCSYFPLEKWTTIKIYLNEDFEDITLMNDISEFINILAKKETFKGFFFIRYKDPKNHLRLRIKLDEIDSIILNNILSFLKNLKNKEYITKVKLDTYTQELMRYGGENLIEKAEELFCFESKICLEFLILIAKEKTELLTIEIYIYFILSLVEKLKLEKQDISIFFEEFEINRKENSVIESLLNINYVNLVRAEYIYKYLEEENEIEIYKLIEGLLDKYLIYWESINKELDKNQKNKIFNSLIHMFFNRLIGIDIELEYYIKGHLKKIIFGRYFYKNKKSEEK